MLEKYVLFLIDVDIYVTNAFSPSYYCTVHFTQNNIYFALFFFQTHERVEQQERRPTFPISHNATELLLDVSSQSLKYYFNKYAWSENMCLIPLKKL